MIKDHYYNMEHDKEIKGVTEEQREMLKYDNFVKTMCGGLFLLQLQATEKKTNEEIFAFVHQLFSVCDAFDKCVVYFIRKLTANFLLDPVVRKKQANGLPLEIACLVDHNSIEEYVQEILMGFGVDAMGVLLIVVPIILKINIHIVNIDTSEKALKLTTFKKTKIFHN